MSKLVITTVGTSLLTNQIKERLDPKDWNRRLNDTANHTFDKITQHDEDVADIISKLRERAEGKLYDEDSEIELIRDISAELNGIYGLYNEKLPEGCNDHHILIATDTAQGQVAAEVIKAFLEHHNFKFVNILTQSELSLASTDVFTESIAKLIPYLNQTIIDYKGNNYRICFNLVGGFKALQGYFNTIGMFYADEIIYVFEGSNQVIKIPKLPVTINLQEVEMYKVPLAMMEQGDVATSCEVLKDVPKDWVVEDGKETTLSTWGQLIWSECKNKLLPQDLLKFPRIHCDSSFINDYEKIKNPKERIKLQETIALVSQKLSLSRGSTEVLFGGGLDFNRYKNTSIDHFRVNDGLRVSCKAVGGNLQLRYYGTHDHVEGKELR